jgi:hypothetical protein
MSGLLNAFLSTFLIPSKAFSHSGIWSEEIETSNTLCRNTDTKRQEYFLVHV